MIKYISYLFYALLSVLPLHHVRSTKVQNRAVTVLLKLRFIPSSREHLITQTMTFSFDWLQTARPAKSITLQSWPLRKKPT